MQTTIINCVSIVLAMIVFLLWPLSTYGQDMGYSSYGEYREGYGSYDRMGQDPDKMIKYGHDMMRYGFREMGMAGGSSKYPGYTGRLSDETIRKLNDEQEVFIKETEDLRQTIYEKELYLKAELVKKSPDVLIALKYQNTISESKGKYEQKMIEHLIRMKKINFEAEKKQKPEKK